LLPPSLFELRRTSRCACNDGRAEFCGLACGTHARNMHTHIPPYSYGLAACARRIYNDAACSGGQGARSSRRAATTGGHEVRTPRSNMAFSKKRHLAQGTPGLVYSSSQRPSRFRRSNRFIGTITSEKRKRGTRSSGLRADDQGDPRNCQIDRQHHERGRSHRTSFRLRVARASTPANGPAGQAGGRRGAGFQIHLKFAFCSNGGISVC